MESNYWNILPLKAVLDFPDLFLMDVVIRKYGLTPSMFLWKCGKKKTKGNLNVLMVWVWNFPHSDSDTFILELFHVDQNVYRAYLNIKTRPRNRCQKFPRKWVPYGSNQNNSLALSEFIHNCCIFVDCTVVWLHACVNVFVLELTLNK